MKTELRERTILHRFGRHPVFQGMGTDLEVVEAALIEGDRVLRDADLAGWELPDANLIGRDLTGCNFRGANLAGANFSSARLAALLHNTDFLGANLTGTILPMAFRQAVRFEREAIVAHIEASGNTELAESIRKGHYDGGLHI